MEFLGKKPQTLMIPIYSTTVLCDTRTGKEFHKNTYKKENLYALIEEDLVMSILEWDQVMVEFNVKLSSKEVVVQLFMQK